MTASDALFIAVPPPPDHNNLRFVPPFAVIGHAAALAGGPEGDGMEVRIVVPDEDVVELLAFLPAGLLCFSRWFGERNTLWFEGPCVAVLHALPDYVDWLRSGQLDGNRIGEMLAIVRACATWEWVWGIPEVPPGMELPAKPL